MNGNSFIGFILKSPFHGIMSASTMLITVTGRKSGRKVTTPVNYYQDGSTLWVLTNPERKWWRNVQSCAEVELRLRGKTALATAEVIRDETALAGQIGEYVKRIPLSARALGVRVVQGQPDPSDLARAAGRHLMIRINLSK